MAMNISFAGKRVLITGGANGVGLALVKRFHDDSALVFTVDRDEVALESLKAEFPNVTSAVVDLSDWDATRKVIESFGAMDHLINNAAVLIQQSFLDTTRESLERMLNVNYSSIVNVSQVIAKGMIDSKIEGSILNISSMVDRITIVGMGVYCSIKSAVTSLTKSMAVELGPHNIRVNAICPGLVNTALLKKDASPQARSYIERSAIKRLTEPSEVADLAYFLLSPFAAMITGDAVLIDGGITTN